MAKEEKKKKQPDFEYPNECGTPPKDCKPPSACAQGSKRVTFGALVEHIHATVAIPPAVATVHDQPVTKVDGAVVDGQAVPTVTLPVASGLAQTAPCVADGSKWSSKEFEKYCISF